MANFRENLLQYLNQYLSEHNQSPSFSEITNAMGISQRSKSLITRSLRQLEKEGRLKLSKSGKRVAISLREKQVPLLGKISAGNPIEAITDYEYIDTHNLFTGTDQFALHVKGTSMVDEGILDGDIIICRKSEAAKEGDIVVALIDQLSVTLKRISYKLKGMVTLVPANSELKPRAYMPERITIQGIYVGLIRTA